MNRRYLLLPLAASLLFVASCNFGSLTKGGGGTEGEGLTGMVVVPDGAPAVNAWVRVYAAVNAGGALSKPAAASAGGAVDSVLSTPGGRYAFPHLPQGTYDLAATVRQGDTTLSLLIRNVVVAGETARGADTLRVSGNLIVRVQAGGAGLEGARCALPSSPWSAVSDSAGDCAFTGLPPGTFRITLSHPSFTGSVTGDVLVTSGKTTGAGSFDLQDGSQTPGAPLQLFPSGPTPETPSAGNLLWRTAPAAASYHVQIATDSAFTFVVLNDSGLLDTVRAYGPLADDTYFWRVRAQGATHAGSWSEAIRFVTVGTGTDDSIPRLVSPAHLGTAPAVSPTLTWTTVTGASSYEVRIALDSTFTDIRHIDSLVQGTSKTIARTLTAGTAHYWRVQALFGPHRGAWSETRIFVTSTAGLPPAAPSLASPADGDTGIAASPTLSWDSVSGAAYYGLLVALDTNFANPVARYDSIPVPRTTQEVGPLAARTVYFWKVNAKGAEGAGPYSRTHWFMTGN